jgi:hypothetical protein
MEKNTLNNIINDLRSRRDALSLCLEHLKHDSDQWNKLQFGLQNAVVSMVPIILSYIIACISALIKFKNYPAQMEVILQSQSLLTNTLTTARNEIEITPQLLKLYNDSLEKLEVSIYPDTRKKFLKESHNSLISIMKQERKYFNMIEMINNKESDINSTNSSIESNITIDS